MYVPAPFRVEDRDALLAFIEREPFGILVSTLDGRPAATHVPFVVLERGEHVTLGLHFAKANPHWHALDGEPVLAIFQGAHAMISAGWYEQAQYSVPTWNYSAVHCSGRAQLADAAGTVRILQRTVERFEPSWRMEAADAAYIARMQQGIAAVEVTVTSAVGAFKHSQNRTPEDRARVIAALSASPRTRDRILADEMRESGKSP